jgi:hypothetical protein
MSNNIEMNTNKCDNWIEVAIDKDYFKYYDYNYFSNIEEIGFGGFGKVFRANWRNSQHVALKSFFNVNNNTLKEIIHEVITQFNNIYCMYFLYIYIPYLILYLYNLD